MQKTKTNKKQKNEPPIPSLQIQAIRENKDGSMDVDIEYQEDWVDVVKRDLNKKKVTKKDIGKHFINLLTKAAQEVDGYKLEVKK